MIRRRVPFVAQPEAAQCGIACLAMVLRYHGRYESLARLRDACGFGRDGVGFLAIADAAASFGLVGRVERFAAEELEASKMPAIVLWEKNRYLVVVRMTPKQVSIIDPRYGPRRIERAAFDRSYGGSALVLAPGEAFTKARRQRSPLRTLAPILRTLVRPLAPVMLPMMIGEIAAFVFPASLVFLLDRVLPNQQLSWLIVLVVVLACVTVLRSLMQLARRRVLGHVRATRTLESTAILVERMLGFERGFLVKRGTAFLTGAVDSHRQLTDAAAQLLLGIFELVVVAVSVTLLVLFSARLAVVAFVTIVVRLAVVSFGRARGADELAKVAIARDRSRAAVLGATGAPELIKALGLEARIEGLATGLRSVQVNARESARDARALGVEGAELVDIIGLAVTLLVGGRAVMAGTMTVGVLFSFLSIEFLLRSPITNLIEARRAVEELDPVIDRLEELDAAPVEPRSDPGDEPNDGHLLVAGVVARAAPHGPIVVDDVSLEATPGKVVALVGPSGSGKSTLLRVIGGLAPLERGVVDYGGVPSALLTPNLVRSRVAVVSCEGTFFDGSVRDNLLLGRKFSDGEIGWALRVAKLDDVVTDLDAPLGPRASSLSGGQRHRLLLARALLARPPIVLLDEVTSSLDERTEIAILERLRGMGLTIVLVTHRPATARRADWVVVLEQGKVAAEGTVAELDGNSIAFRRLMKQENAA